MTVTPAITSGDVSIVSHARVYPEPAFRFDSTPDISAAILNACSATNLRLAIHDANLSPLDADTALATVAEMSEHYQATGHMTFGCSREQIEKRTGKDAKRALQRLEGQDIGGWMLTCTERGETWSKTSNRHDGTSKRSQWRWVRTGSDTSTHSSTERPTLYVLSDGARITQAVSGTCEQSAAFAIAPLCQLDVVREATLPVRCGDTVNRGLSPTPTAPDNTQDVVSHLPNERLSNAADSARRLVDALPIGTGASATSSTALDSTSTAARRYVEVHDYNGNGCKQDATDRCGAPFDHVHDGIIYADYFTQEDVEWVDKFGVRPGFWL